MKTLLILILVSSVSCQSESCTTKDGRRGTCTSFRNCRQASDDHKNGIAVSFCASGWTCCPSGPPGSSSSSGPPANGLRKRLSAQKCEEYSKLTVEESIAISLLPSSAGSSGQIIKSYNCKQISTGLVVGGQEATVGEFPHSAEIGWFEAPTRSYSFQCGGSLISNNFVLTAAHCYRKLGSPRDYPKIVRLGDHNLKNRDDGLLEKDVRIQQFILHENYGSQVNDIALIKLAESVGFTEFIRPACLWQTTNIPTDKALVSGHGSPDYGVYHADELRKAEIPIRTFANCSANYPTFNRNSQICAGGNGTDSCQGDSGGPLQIRHGENVCMYHLIGVVSYGPMICGYVPGIYTRVSNYLDWIENKVWK